MPHLLTKNHFSTNFFGSLSQLTQLLLLLSCLFPMAGLAQDPLEKNNSQLNSVLLAPQDSFLPVQEAFQLEHRIQGSMLVLTWKIADTYYLYQERFKFRLDNAVLIANYNEAQLKYDELFERETLLHYKKAEATLDLSSYNSAVTIKVEYQGCAEAGLCYPPQRVNFLVDRLNQSVQPQLLSAESSPVTLADTTDSRPTPAPEGFNWVLRAMLLALLGGAILNLMPCVFPVLSIKIMSLAAADRSQLVTHGWVYTLGILSCFLVFAAMLILARLGGEAVGWGFQLQSPALIAVLAYLFFIMGLSMSGLIHFGAGLMGTGQQLTQRPGLTGSFFTGVLAAVVASPCTAPFMGTALGFALTQPAMICIAIFAALGFGMAAPLLLLCYIPSLAARLPKPGMWMDNLKHFLAYPLYLSAVWLLWVLGRQTDVTVMAALCCGAVAIALGCWLLGGSAQGWQGWSRRLIMMAAYVTAIILPWQQLHHYQTKSDAPVSRWQPYSPEKLQAARAEGLPVLINLTADWCLTCLANERITLSTHPIEAAFDAHNVITLKGDWTNNDPQITALLKEYGRSGVPLYLWFPANRTGKADILPQLLTKEFLIATIKGEINNN